MALAIPDSSERADLAGVGETLPVAESSLELVLLPSVTWGVDNDGAVVSEGKTLSTGAMLVAVVAAADWTVPAVTGVLGCSKMATGAGSNLVAPSPMEDECIMRAVVDDGVNICPVNADSV